jgi:hypothetical protein
MADLTILVEIFAKPQTCYRWGTETQAQIRKAKLPNFNCKFLRRLCIYACLLAILGRLAGAQNSGTQNPHAGEPAAQTRPQERVQQPPAQQPDQKISPQAEQELFRSIDQLLKFASDDTALPIRHPVQKRLVSRDEVVAFIQKHMMEDKDAQRLERSELILKKWGLLPHDFELQPFLLKLLREQVEGYYDPQTKTVNMLDWVEPDQQKPVMAHELTHALQDQSFDLEKFMKAGDVDLGTMKNDPTPEDIVNDEAGSAHQAIVEGQAMVVSIDYELAPMHQSVANSPEIVEALKATIIQGTADSTEFHSAPLYIKEALTFPYRYGLDFESELLSKFGKEKAFAAVFQKPPRTTREIMEPAAYLSNEKLDGMVLPEFTKDFKDYEKFDVGAVGEFDVAILIEQYAGNEAAKRLYPEWRGGYYYAVRPKKDPKGPLGLLYLSRWTNPERASEFAWVYAKGLKQRYQKLSEADDDPPKEKPAGYVVETLTGKHIWMTEEGTLFIEVAGNTVLICESLDGETTSRLEHELLPGDSNRTGQ